MKKNNLPATAALISFLVSSTWMPAALADELDLVEKEGPLIQSFFLTETVYPQAQGETQITLVPSYFSNNGDGDDLLLGLSVEYGITDRFAVGAGWIPYRKIYFDQASDQSGPGDLELGVKYAFDKNEDLQLQIAIGLGVTLPTGDEDKGLSEGNRVYEPFIVLSKDFGDDTNIHFNLAYGFVEVVNRPHEIGLAEKEEIMDGGKDGANGLALNLGLVTKLSPHWRGTLELNLETNEIDDGEETESFFTPGLVWKGLDDFEFGLGVPIGLTDESPDWGLIAKASYEF